MEHIMTEQVGDSGGIGDNVNRFIAEGYIAPKEHYFART
jgi:hypothetical protein